MYKGNSTVLFPSNDLKITLSQQEFEDLMRNDFEVQPSEDLSQVNKSIFYKYNVDYILSSEVSKDEARDFIKTNLLKDKTDEEADFLYDFIFNLNKGLFKYDITSDDFDRAKQIFYIAKFISNELYTVSNSLGKDLKLIELSEGIWKDRK